MKHGQLPDSMKTLELGFYLKVKGMSLVLVSSLVYEIYDIKDHLCNRVFFP